MATHSRILSWKVPCTEEPCKKSDRTEDTYNSCFQYWPFQFLRTHSIQNKLVQLVFLHANITLRQTCWVKFFMGPTYTKCVCVQNFIYFSEIQMQLCPTLAQMAKNPPAIQDTWVQSLGQEDPLEDSIATYSIILAWRILWTEDSGSLQYLGSQESG